MSDVKYNMIVVDFYVGADFSGLWVHYKAQYPIFEKLRIGFVVTFEKCTILLVSKIQTDIDLYSSQSEYLGLSQSVIDLITLKHFIN